MQELREDQVDKFKREIPKDEENLKAFVEKIKEDILISIENSTPEEVEIYRAQLIPEALEFFDSKEIDSTAAQTRHFAIFSVLDRLTPEQIKLIKDGVGEDYAPILHDLRNVIQMHQSIRKIVEMNQPSNEESIQH